MVISRAVAFVLIAGVACATCGTTVACGSGCSKDADCVAASPMCCQGACVPSNEANCGACGAKCLLGTSCGAQSQCTGSGTSACAITDAISHVGTGTCELSASWACINGGVSCHCNGSAGTCTCPSGGQVDAPFVCPTCDATIEQLTKLATLCNISPPTP